MAIMMRFLIVFVAVHVLWSCEEVIDIEINDAEPKVVIEANILNEWPSYVYITKTTKLSEDSRDKHLEEMAVVRVIRDDGLVISFEPTATPGVYLGARDRVAATLVPNHTYTLYVDIGDQRFTAEEYMHPFVDVDSTGIGIRNIFNDNIYFASLRFQDPAQEENYYRYDVSINSGDFQFNSVYNDRFNDGLQVVHEILSPEENLVTGDVMRIRRSVISKSVYQYWNDMQSVHPGSVAPANPRSNISNGALGYFSVSSTQLYDFSIHQIIPTDPEDPDNLDDNGDD